MEQKPIETCLALMVKLQKLRGVSFLLYLKPLGIKHKDGLAKAVNNITWTSDHLMVPGYRSLISWVESYGMSIIVQFLYSENMC